MDGETDIQFTIRAERPKDLRDETCIIVALMLHKIRTPQTSHLPFYDAFKLNSPAH